MGFKMILSVVFMLFALAACDNSDTPPEKGNINKATDKVAEEVVESIKKPIAKAELAKELSEGHNKKIKESAN